VRRSHSSLNNGAALQTDVQTLAAERTMRPSFLDRRVNLAAEPLTINWVIQDLAARGLLTVVAGQTTAGKTQLALQCASAIDSPDGGDVAGLCCYAGRAIYLDAENGSTVIHERLRAAEMPVTMPYYLDLKGVRLDRERDRELLAETIRQTDATLAVIDSLRRFAGDTREDSADDMAQIVGGIRSSGPRNPRRNRCSASSLYHGRRCDRARLQRDRGSSGHSLQARPAARLKASSDLLQAACRR
jgi:RecA-family ATPase